MNRDKGPFRAAVSGLKSTRGRALAVAQAVGGFGFWFRPQLPTRRHWGAACRGFASESRLSLKSTWAGTKPAGLFPFKTPRASNFFFFFTCFPLLKSGHKNCPGDLTRVLLLHSNE